MYLNTITAFNKENKWEKTSRRREVTEFIYITEKHEIIKNADPKRDYEETAKLFLILTLRKVVKQTQSSTGEVALDVKVC